MSQLKIIAVVSSLFLSVFLIVGFGNTRLFCLPCIIIGLISLQLIIKNNFARQKKLNELSRNRETDV